MKKLSSLVFIMIILSTLQSIGETTRSNSTFVGFTDKTKRVLVIRTNTDPIEESRFELEKSTYVLKSIRRFARSTYQEQLVSFEEICKQKPDLNTVKSYSDSLFDETVLKEWLSPSCAEKSQDLLRAIKRIWKHDQYNAKEPYLQCFSRYTVGKNASNKLDRLISHSSRERPLISCGGVEIPADSDDEIGFSSIDTVASSTVSLEADNRLDSDEKLDSFLMTLLNPDGKQNQNAKGLLDCCGAKQSQDACSKLELVDSSGTRENTLVDNPTKKAEVSQDRGDTPVAAVADSTSQQINYRPISVERTQSTREAPERSLARQWAQLTDGSSPQYKSASSSSRSGRSSSTKSKSKSSARSRRISDSSVDCENTRLANGACITAVIPRNNLAALQVTVLEPPNIPGVSKIKSRAASTFGVDAQSSGSEEDSELASRETANEKGSFRKKVPFSGADSNQEDEPSSSSRGAAIQLGSKQSSAVRAGGVQAANNSQIPEQEIKNLVGLRNYLRNFDGQPEQVLKQNWMYRVLESFDMKIQYKSVWYGPKNAKKGKSYEEFVREGS